MSYLKSISVYSFVALGLASPLHAVAVPVSLELSLLIDVSPSVDNTEYQLQLSGYQAAFQDVAVQSAIASLPGGIAANAIFFSQNAVEKIGWTQLTDAASANAFASLFPNLSRTPPVNNGTDIADGYNFAIGTFNNNGFEGSRLVIDISGDGPQNLNNGCPSFGNGTNANCVAQTNAARTAAELADIVVNGIVIGPNDPSFGPNTGVEYYTDYIITTTGFAVAATDFQGFPPVLRSKILREITNNDVPEPVTMALLAMGLAGIGLATRKGNAQKLTLTRV